MGMDEGRIRRLVLTAVAGAGEGSYLPVGVSARHVHLSEADFHLLFGKEGQLHKEKDISQPGQFAAKEKVTLQGRKGSIENVRILGPFRKETQVEISLTDSFLLGEKDTPVRLSGDLEGTPGLTLVGPAGSLRIPKGLIIAERHAHFSENQAAVYGVKDGQKVSVRIEGKRPGTLEAVICRVGAGHELELHIDTDEANAFGLANGSLAELVTEAGPRMVPQKNLSADARKVLSPGTKPPEMPPVAVPAPPRKEESPRNSIPREKVLDLVKEAEIRAAFKNNERKIYCSKKALITPAAADAAAAGDMEIVRLPEVETKKREINW